MHTNTPAPMGQSPVHPQRIHWPVYPNWIASDSGREPAPSQQGTTQVHTYTHSQACTMHISHTHTIKNKGQKHRRQMKMCFYVCTKHTFKKFFIHLIKHLTHKVEDLSSEPQPQNPQETPILAAYACNTSKCKMGDRSSRLVNLICFDTKPLSVFVSKNREREGT